MISWRNPDARHADWGLDTYVARRARRAGRGRARSPAPTATALAGVCSGGILASLAAAHLAAHRPAGPAGRRSPCSSPCSTTATQAGTSARSSTTRLAAAAKAMSRTAGLPRRPGAGRGVRLAAARRPDLELLGQQLPARQAAAGVRHPVLERRHHPDDRRPARRLRRHRRCDNPLVQAGRDHRARRADRPARSPSTPTSSPASPTTSRPWQNCYRSTQLLGGDDPLRAVHQRPHRRAGQPADATRRRPTRPTTTTPPTPQEWLHGADTQQGSWWPDFADWLGDRCGADRPHPPSSAAAACAPLAEAPGTYVFEN